VKRTQFSIFLLFAIEMVVLSVILAKEDLGPSWVKLFLGF